MNKIALLGTTYHEKCKKLNSRLDKDKIVLWGWTYKHTPQMLKILERQKTFNIYAYNSYNRTENKEYAKKIFYYYTVYDFKYSTCKTEPPKPDLVIHGFDERIPEKRGWYFINGYRQLQRPKKWTDFRDYDTGKHLDYNVPRNPNVNWIYVIDEFECD